MKRIKEDDYLKINEFAQMVDIKPSRLRFYDKQGILVPEKRGKDKNDSYRYYSPTQISVAKMIKVLQQIGIKLEEIKELEKNRSPDALIRLLTKNESDILYELHFLNELYSIVRIYQDLIVAGISANESKISVCEMPERTLMLGEPTSFADGECFHNEYLKFSREPRSPKVNISYPIGGYYESMDALVDHPSQPDRFFSLDPDGYERKERGLYLVGYTRGYYGELNDLPERMIDYARKNKVTFDGPVYNIYLLDELCMPDNNQYLLQVSASIKQSDYRVVRHSKRSFEAKI